MADPLIKSIRQSPRVGDPLRKPDEDKRRKRQPQPQNKKKKDSRRIIDTYA